MTLLPLALVVGCAKHPETPLPRTLAECPSSPNCVYSRTDASDTEHAIAPFDISGDADAAWAKVASVVDGMPRTSLIDEGPDYRHYVFTTAIMRFKDDVQLELDRDGSVIHFRSASRVGKSDLGVNRRRMESIRAALSAE